MGKEKLKKILEKLISDFDYKIEADDTHRWVKSDGFYEVQFELIKDDIKIFIHNESGNQNLEDKWSKNNPQIVTVTQTLNLMDYDFDCEYVINMLNEKLPKHIIKAVFKQRQKHI